MNRREALRQQFAGQPLELLEHALKLEAELSATQGSLARVEAQLMEAQAYIILRNCRVDYPGTRRSPCRRNRSTGSISFARICWNKPNGRDRSFRRCWKKKTGSQASGDPARTATRCRCRWKARR
jgi:hypothetical protein